MNICIKCKIEPRSGKTKWCRKCWKEYRQKRRPETPMAKLQADVSNLELNLEQLREALADEIAKRGTAAVAAYCHGNVHVWGSDPSRCLCGQKAG